MDIVSVLVAVLFQTIFQVNSYACIPQADKDLMVQNIITSINSAKSAPVAQTPVTHETPVLGGTTEPTTPVAPIVSEACQGAVDNYKDMVAVVQNNKEGRDDELKNVDKQSVGEEAKARYRSQVESEWTPRIAKWQKIADDRKAIMDETCK